MKQKRGSAQSFQRGLKKIDIVTQWRIGKLPTGRCAHAQYDFIQGPSKCFEVTQIHQACITFM